MCAKLVRTLSDEGSTPDSLKYKIAHDLNDATRLRSKDVELEEDVTFEDLMLNRITLAGLERCGFHRPSPIQLETIPIGRCGFDLIVQSKAGTGKTCIFAIIALEALQFNPNKCTQTIIVAPTREIAIQIHEVISLVGSVYKDLRCALCIGGIDVKQDRNNLLSTRPKGESGSCQIVVGTPGRLKQLMELNILKTQQVELFVIDEVDKLMDDQFKSQIDEIYKRLPIDRQIIVTSATYTDDLSQFLECYMQTPTCKRVGKEISLEAIQEMYVESRSGHSGKKTLEKKLTTLQMLLNQSSFAKCIIFTNFQGRAPIICDWLNNNQEFSAKFGPVHYICAERSQDERNRIFKNFKCSDQKLLVSTDISARGIDIQDIELVVNLDLPTDNPTYYHRIGRAGRFGQVGKAISIVSTDSVDQTIFKKIVDSPKIVKLTLNP